MRIVKNLPIFLGMSLIVWGMSGPAWSVQEVTGMGGIMGANPMAQAASQDDRRVTMDFEDAALKSILKAFSRQTGVNFVASDIIEGKKITVYLNNVSVEEALTSILEANGLSFESQGENVFLIKPAGTAQIRTETRVFRLEYIQVYEMSASKEDGSAFGDTSGGASDSSLTGDISAGGSSSGQKVGSSGASEGDKPRNVIEIVKTLMSPYGKIVADKRTNSLIITDIPSRFRVIEDTLRKLDIEPLQVLIEAEILETTTSAAKRIGVEIGSETQTAGFTWGQTTGEEGSNLSIPLAAPLTQSYVKDQYGQTLSGSELFSYGTLTQASTEIALKLFLKDQDTKVLSRPRVMTVNNEEALIKITANTAIGIESTTLSQSGEVLSKAERVETGIVLKVLPQVNSAGDIFMFIEPSVANVQASANLISGNQFLDPQVRSSSSTVMVRNGETVVIAGLIKTNNTDTTRKVPFLSDIPFIGEVFKSKTYTTEDTEILIFITPRVVKKGDKTMRPPVVAEKEDMVDAVLQKYAGKGKKVDNNGAKEETWAEKVEDNGESNEKKTR
ncbi:MAG: secretin N-terminal domain-containing protein [Candidatus Omnitrophica bacterium]|nr:secretin N-terminal domain-containing protein [Candidatus Omnitrophota bacterium]MDD5488529.1 secretin N-terminal domain-containing protein [Candidatus Omnitrophota bacterium]